MIFVDTDVGTFGPYATVEVLDDRLRVDEAELPFTVIGNWERLEAAAVSGE
ncbi:hypothetical protein [Pseudoduganella sp. RAF53_2]|uniref:hypothetical protein n=1 Tax=unclassified Pseudoduganella TaxID=2637179 RepID=UPI003F9D0F5D